MSRNFLNLLIWIKLVGQMMCQHIFWESLITNTGIRASLFQKSLDQGQLPNDWIIANVVPILKKGEKIFSK